MRRDRYPRAICRTSSILDPRVRHAAYPLRWTSGLLGGSSVLILPLNKTCDGSCPSSFSTLFPMIPCSCVLSLCGRPSWNVRLALLKPPISASHMTLHRSMLSDESNCMSGRGFCGTCSPSILTAMLACRRISSTERFQKPGMPLRARQIGVANILFTRLP